MAYFGRVGGSSCERDRSSNWRLTKDQEARRCRGNSGYMVLAMARQFISLSDRYYLKGKESGTRLQPSLILTGAAIPHVIWGQDAVHYSLGGAFIFREKLDLQILLPPSRIQEAVKLLAPSYSPMSCEEIDGEKRALTASKKGICIVDYTLAFRDRPDDFARLKALQRGTKSDPYRVLLISNTIFNYNLDDIVQVSLPLCPDLPFPSVPALVHLMPIHIQKWIDAGYSPQSWAFIEICQYMLESAINDSFCEEVEEEYHDADDLPTRLKEMIVCLDEREKGWVYDYFLLDGESDGESDDEAIWDTIFPPSVAKTDSHGK
ncbi:uncharacterized protein EV420DRAFT_1473823 [Desarmillaria tabescens]|uniref:Uncharacterized protein n=1 Tax=Armillaria tabescens TaxID=1929756 RepID=A0AA39TW05_ARMTA|nr:uncharacterized protein EV420DRAFT_1473823 [Desarmillaria tabescens]KAK0468058.1 hypothetical protein EV420DRAFT_1473823 [Desarmillaria tabescens]